MSKNNNKLNELLEEAIEEDDFDLIKECIEKGADIGSLGPYVMQDAIRSHELEMVKFLFDKINPDEESKRSFVNNAVKEGCFEILVYLMENGCNAEGVDKEALQVMVETNDLDSFQYLILNNHIDPHKDNEYILTIAVHASQIEMVEILIQKGADISANKYSPILLAIEMGYLEMIKLLINQGVTINYANDCFLQKAIKVESLEIVKLLVESGSNVNYDKKNGLSALELATRHNSSDFTHKIMIFLIENGANLSLQVIKNVANGSDLNSLKYLVLNCKQDINEFINFSIGNEKLKSWAEEYKKMDDFKKNLEKDLINQKVNTKKIKI